MRSCWATLQLSRGVAAAESGRGIEQALGAVVLQLSRGVAAAESAASVTLLGVGEGCFN